ERGMDPHLHGVLIHSHADAYQLDHVAQLPRTLDVALRDLGNSLDVDVRNVDAAVEGDAAENGGLMLRVESAYVARGVGLGISERLGLFQDGVELGAFA